MDPAGVAGRHLLQTATPKYVELFIVSDVDQTRIKGGAANANTLALSVAAAVNVMYAKITSLKIIVSVVVTQAWTVYPSGVPVITDSSSLSTYLTSFSKWAATKKSGITNHDNAQLLVGRGLSGSTAGVGWIKTICSRTLSSAVSEDASSQPGKTATGYKVWTIEVMTHEMGHNFGSQHDSLGNSCPSSGFIMAAIGRIVTQATVSAKVWSTCSVSYINSAIQGLSGTPSDCLKNLPRARTAADTVTECGDGIIDTELGEECDPGSSPDLCTADCKLKPGVVCTHGECCDLTNGQLKPLGSVCRIAMHQCDYADYCTGNNTDCPQDDFKADGTSCIEAGAGGQCYSGSCKGIAGQCREDFANYAVYATWTRAPDSCYMRDGVVDECGAVYCQMNGDGGCYALNMTDDGGASWLMPVSENTPCAGSTKVCKMSECVAPGAAVTCAGGCGSGACSGLGSCVCPPGYHGAGCSTPTVCPLDCSALNRLGCIADGICGGCKDRFESPTDGVNSACSWYSPLASSTLGSQAIFGSTTSNAFDNEPFSHFVSNFTTSYIQTHEVYVGGKFDYPFTLTAYRVMSGNTLPSEDPSTWTIEGASSASPDQWTVLDSQTMILFEERHLTKTYAIDCRMAPFDMYRLHVTAVADAALTPSLQVAELYFIHKSGQPIVAAGCGEIPEASANAAAPGVNSVSTFLLSVFVVLLASFF
jgi:hypothetical protein